MSAVVGTTAAAGIVGLSVFSNNITAPTQIPGLLGWYDGLDPLGTGVVPLNGFNISNWIDKSGRSNNASNIGGSIPSYSNNAVYFNGSASNRLFFTNPNELVANKAFSIFAVEKRQGSATSSYFLAGTTALQRQNLHMGYRYGFEFAVAFYSDDQNITIPNYTTAATEPYRIWTTTLNSSFLGITYLNGTTQGSYQHGGRVTSYTGGAIGGTPTFPGWYTGFIQELIFFSNVVTATQQQQIEGYLAWKWGLASNLPVTSFQQNSNVSGIPAVVSVANAYNAPFTNFITAPTQVPGLQLWLDGADSNQITLSGSNITQWLDKSGNVNTFTPTSGAPTYNTTEQGVSFVSSNSSNSDVMRSSSNIAFRVGSNTVFLVAKIPTNPFLNFQMIFNVGVGIDNSLRTNFNSPPNIYPNQGFTGTGNTLYYTGIPILNTGLDTPSYSATTRFILDSVYGSGLGNLTTQVTLSSATLIGGGFRSLTGFINEVLVYSNALTANQRTQVEGYLAWKWGINSNLPVSHYQQNSTTTGIVAPIPTTAPRFIASSFLPTAYNGLTLWLDANDSATVLNPGTSNMVWIDKSGTGKNAIVSPSNASLNFYGTFPTYCNAGNIPASIQFNCNVMYCQSNIGVAQSTFFIILQNILPFTGSRAVFSIASSFQQPYNSVDAFEVGMSLFAGSSVTPSVAYGLTQGTYTGINFATQNVPSPSTNQYPFSMLSFTETNTATINTFTNGAAAQSATNSATRSNTGRGYAICGEWIIQNLNFAATNMGTFNISEIILYSNVLTGQQRQQVEGYLAWKWGLTPSLPITHQNAYVPP